MTILFLSIEFNYCCGISRSIFSLARELQQRGHNIVLGVPGGTMVNDFTQSGMEYVFVPIHPQNKKITDFIRSIATVRKVLNKFKVDVVHSHHRLGDLISWIVGSFTNVQTVSTAHALVSGKKFLSFRSGKLIAVSHAVESMLVNEFLIRKEKIQLIRNIPRPLRMPSESETLEFKRQYQIFDDEFVVVGVGRLHPEKGYDVLLKAIQRLSHMKGIKAVLVGKGTEEKRLKLFAEKHKLNIVFIDEINEVELIYSIADVVVVPSRQESAGLVAIEAANFCKPVIASNVGGLKETIENEKTGLLVPPENDIMLAKAIERLYNNKFLAEQIGFNLHVHVTKEYNRFDIATKTESLYLKATHLYGNS